MPLRRITLYMRSKGYLQAQTGEPRIEALGQRATGFFIPLPLVASKDDALRITIPVVEGKLFRIGEMKIEGTSILSEGQIRSVIGLQRNDIADGERIGKALYTDLKRIYASQGFIEYEPEVEAVFHDNPGNAEEGIVDFAVSINEGTQFRLGRVEFEGNTFTRDNVLRREILINEGDIYNQLALEHSIARLNQLGIFDPIDKDRDVKMKQR